MGRVIYGSDRNKSARAAIVADVVVPIEASVAFLAPVEPLVVYIDREVPVIQEVPVDRQVIVEKIVTVEKIVEVPVEKIVTIEKIVTVEKPVMIEVPVEKIVEKIVPVERIVNIENIERALEERKRANIYVKRLSISAIINVFLLILLGVVCVQR